MVLYYNNDRENGKNTIYPYKAEISSPEDLEKVMHYDHMCAKCEGNRRKGDNFISADCSMFDVDNTDSDDPKKWTTPKDVKKAFPDVMFFVSYSRNHMKEKDGKTPRPKFHVYFPDATYDAASKYSKHKEKVCQYFTAFDPNAKDATRVFFGVEQPKVEYFSGTQLLSEFMNTVTIPTKSEGKRIDKHVTNQTGMIPEGERNSTLFKIAINIRSTKGDGENAFQSFLRYYEASKIHDDPKEMADYVMSFTEKYSMTFPGWEPERMAKLDELFEKYKPVTKEKLWDNLKCFLEAIMPTCRECDIKMAIHMDDPPWDIFGLPRLLTSGEAIDRFLSMVDDPYNCLTLCSGSLNANPDNNVADIVRRHCDRIAFAHSRNVKHFENGDFSEASHRDCDGDTGILDILKAYHDCGFDGYIRPDHGRHLWTEGPGTVRPGYGLYDRALGIMYMLGVWDSLDKFDNK